MHNFLKEISKGKYSFDPDYKARLLNAGLKIVAFAGETPVGFVCGNFSRPRNLAYGLGLYVLLGYRGKKIATRLSRRFGWQARQRGFSRIFLTEMRAGTAAVLKAEAARLDARLKRNGGRIEFSSGIGSGFAKINLSPKISGKKRIK